MIEKFSKNKLLILGFVMIFTTIIGIVAWRNQFKYKIDSLYPKDEIMMTAIHEAGHCIVDENLMPNSVQEVDIIPTRQERNNPDIKGLPGHTYLLSPKDNSTNNDILFKEAVGLRAGSEAAILYAGNNQQKANDAMDSAYGDNQKMVSDLIAIMRNENMFKYSNKDIKTEADIPPEDGRYYLMLESKAIDEAKDIIKSNKNKIMPLANELAKEKNLSGDAVREILKNN